MKIGNKTVGGAFSGFGIFLTIMAGIAIGMAEVTLIPAVSVICGGTMGICGYLYFIWGLRRIGIVSETNRWLKFSAVPNHKAKKKVNE